MNRRRFLNWCAAMVVVPCLDWTMKAPDLTLPEVFEAQFEWGVLRMSVVMG